MTADPAGPHPVEQLRAIVSRHIDELRCLRDDKKSPPDLGEHEKIARVLIAYTKAVDHLFDSKEDAAARKTGDELKKEDDAIRAEFARRLAAIVRGRRIAGARRDAEAAEASSAS
jgi:hypothetical protein